MERSINRKAHLMAKQYVTDCKLPDTDFDKTYLVYKFVETPLSAMQVGLQGMVHTERARSYFKTLAKQLHPDKNGHPMAKEAFQKLNMALDAVKKQSAF
jgi:hypothetical protein